MEKIKVIIIILSVYFSWLVILNSSNDTALFEPIPLTILTIYVWKQINN